MSASNPYLIGIALVTKKKAEPHLVFHYPPKPGEDNSYFKNLFKDDLIDTTSSSSDDDDSASEGDIVGVTRSNESPNKDSPPDLDEAKSASPRKGPILQQGNKRLLWNDVFGYNSGVLAKALCPANGCYKRFEVSLGRNVVLGRPVYAKEDGTWKKKRARARKSSDRTTSIVDKQSLGVTTSTKAPELAVDDSGETEDLKKQVGDVETKPDRNEDWNQADPLTSRPEPNEASKNLDSNDSMNPHAEQPEYKDTLVMFHIVFVLRPPALEYHVRVKDMYEHIVKKFTRALKLEQARSSYVGKEAAMISSIAERTLKSNKENPPLTALYRDIMSQSSLAKAIATLYENISSSKIAHLNLTPNMSLSLQIPAPTSISILPTPLAPQMPGLWLTTADSMPADDDDSRESSQPSSHFTLLLLHDLRTILADINTAASPISGPLTDFLMVSKPTKSFLQISEASGIPLADVHLLASHLIYWRRARAIPPLRQSDIYIVSPNADMQELASASARFAKAFPMMPSLPRILSMLSSPKPYSALIPNKDRKGKFMDILAWLLRGGWVTQLRTHAWIRVPSELRAVVDQEQGEQSIGNHASETKVSGDGPKDTKAMDPSNTSPRSKSQTAGPVDDFRARTSSVLISNPRLASALPSQYLSAISARIQELQGRESQLEWEKCVRYFDGKHAMETIAVREGWQRRHVADLIASWERLGFLTKTRHW